MNDKPTVLYNGACPICRREIEHYQRLDRRSDGSSLAFVDISQESQVLERHELTRDDAKRRLHVVDGDGRLLAGVPAFAAIWDRLPRYRWLAAIARLPLISSVLPWLYEPIAFWLYRADKKRHRSADGVS